MCVWWQNENNGYAHGMTGQQPNTPPSVFSSFYSAFVPHNQVIFLRNLEFRYLGIVYATISICEIPHQFKTKYSL